ncbi:MAG: hypothetical protein HY830_18010 [Actinobacteria bacterium]|nr:hypothetical protein [Actinomycetota bacterium]
MTLGTAAEASPEAAPAFTVRVPPSWFRFDAWRATRTADLARIVDARIATQPGLRRHRAALLALFREVAEDAQARGALMCAVGVDPVAAGGPLLASLMVFRTDGDPLHPLQTVEEIAASVTAHEGAEGPGTWRRVGLVDLPAGPAVRVTSVGRLQADAADRDGGPDAAPDLVAMHTLVPAPGGGVVDVVLTSPQASIADALLDLFDAVSGTFAWAVPTDPERTDPAPGSDT